MPCRKYNKPLLRCSDTNAPDQIEREPSRSTELVKCQRFYGDLAKCISVRATLSACWSRRDTMVAGEYTDYTSQERKLSFNEADNIELRKKSSAGKTCKCAVLPGLFSSGVLLHMLWTQGCILRVFHQMKYSCG